MAVRSYLRRYGARLAGPGTDNDDPNASIRRRPDPSSWTALEYTAHVADVIDRTGPVIRRVLVTDEPELSFPQPDEVHADPSWNRLDRTEVLVWLDLATAELASVLESVGPYDWARTARFEWGSEDALGLARTAVHEGSHHLRDIERTLAAVRGRPG